MVLIKRQGWLRFAIKNQNPNKRTNAPKGYVHFNLEIILIAPLIRSKADQRRHSFSDLCRIMNNNMIKDLKY